MSNADRIKAMSEKELAKFLQEIAVNGGVDCNCEYLSDWLSWLKEEEKENA